MPEKSDEKCFVNGQWVPGDDYGEVRNPYTDEIIAKMPVAGERILEKALESAAGAFKPFARLSRDERAKLLNRIADGIEADCENIAKLICSEGGKPIKLARGEVDRAMVTCRWAAGEAVRLGGEWLPLDIHPGARAYTSLVGRVPVGPALAISPFNFPLNLIMHKLAPAIAVGCPTIVKPSSETPLTALRLAEICEKAGCPPGTVQVTPCPGSVFEKAITDSRPAMVSFTGSADVGWHIKSIAGRKHVALELGGNAGVIVDRDADLNFAAERIVSGGFAHAGQVCISVQRVFVHEDIYEQFVELLIEATGKVKSGDPTDEDVIVGPMITSHEVDRVEAWIEEAVKAGARIIMKGSRQKNVLGPYILGDVPRDAKVQAKEVFGPVIIVTTFDNWDHALELVNDSVYGLQAGIFTSDINKVKNAYDEIEVGTVIVNDIPTVRVDNYPYGGVKESGRGREGVRCTMMEMTEERVLVMRF